MENASKAIIIGGSVLVAILIVSLGIVIYNSSKGTTGTAKEAVDTLEVQLYNQKFEKYLKDEYGYGNEVWITGKTLKKLVSEAIASKSNIRLYFKGAGGKWYRYW